MALATSEGGVISRSGSAASSGFAKAGATAHNIMVKARNTQNPRCTPRRGKADEENVRIEVNETMNNTRFSYHITAVARNQALFSAILGFSLNPASELLCRLSGFVRLPGETRVLGFVMVFTPEVHANIGAGRPARQRGQDARVISELPYGLTSLLDIGDTTEDRPNEIGVATGVHRCSRGVHTVFTRCWILGSKELFLTFFGANPKEI
jgi:hypothetical protein